MSDCEEGEAMATEKERGWGDRLHRNRHNTWLGRRKVRREGETELKEEGRHINN